MTNSDITNLIERIINNSTVSTNFELNFDGEDKSMYKEDIEMYFTLNGISYSVLFNLHYTWGIDTILPDYFNRIVDVELDIDLISLNDTDDVVTYFNFNTFNYKDNKEIIDKFIGFISEHIKLS